MSWSWCKLLQLREIVRPFFWVRLGNGLNTSLWYGMWCTESPLIRFLSPRDIAKEGYSITSCVADVMLERLKCMVSALHPSSFLPYMAGNAKESQYAINVEGLPPLARNIGAVKAVLKDFGRILEMGPLDFETKFHAPIKLLVLRTCMNEVSESLPVTLNGKTYLIRVFEDRFNAGILIPSSSSVNDFKDSKYFGFLSSESKEDSPFEEEFVGPSLLNGDDGLNSGGRSLPNGEFEKSSFQRLSDNANGIIEDQPGDLRVMRNIGELIRPHSSTDFAFSNTVGASGGILTMWNSNIFTMKQRILDRNFVAVLRKWAGVSYFNAVRTNDERDGCAFDEGEANSFNDFISRVGLFDFPLNGRRFTRFDKNGTKVSKLDRFLVTHNFLDLWSDASVSVLCRSYSDHCPILLQVGLPDLGPKSFNFFDKWIGVAELVGVIANALASTPNSPSPDLRLKDKIKTLRSAIRCWAIKRASAEAKAKEDMLNYLVKWDIKVESGQINQFDVDKLPDDIKHAALDHFASRFKYSNSSRPSFTSNLFRKLSTLDSNLLESNISLGEIKCAHFEATSTIANGCNPSFIVLIPKKQDPLSFSDYCPISLIGCIYKIISKILASRLAKVMPSIIGPNQTAFIAGRQILGGCLVANEIIRMANIEKHKLLLFKVDFEKAFDSVNWIFLCNTMRQMGFGEKWIKWICACLSSASISVLVNGSPSREFKMERGLRQEDPLSSFLFLIVTEALQIPILEACNKVRSKYADDALFFGDWSRINVKNLILILKCFENASGLKINLSKSKIYGVGVLADEVEVIASSLGYDHGSIPFMYLGLPVGKRMRFSDGWNVVVNRFRDRLSSWKSKSLSIGGRLTLIRSIFGSLPIYYLSLFLAPKKVINLLESIRCRFFWGHNESHRDICWVKWNSILLDHSSGGLGVGSIFAKNLGLLGKWKWRFLTEKEVLWRMVIKEFYGEDGGLFSLAASHDSSGVWVDIIKAVARTENIVPSFRNSFVLKISNGSSIS
ncbi:putative RNA-directed DNA polymerase, partial [Tanacetum coccineum]